MILSLLGIGGGVVLLVLGGHFLVQGAVALALRLRVSPLVIGLTIVGFGTSMPELATSVQAAWRDAPGIAVGNVVGSNICNILLILGLSALIFPVTVDRKGFRRDGAFLVAATVLGAGLVATGMLDRLFGLLLLAGLAGYMVLAFRTEAHPQIDDTEFSASPAPMGRAILEALGGILATILGAHLLVSAAVDLAQSAGISEAVIGLSIVAVGTSLPELATSVVATWKRQSDVCFGNIVGSNIFNILGILGTTALLSPITVRDSVSVTDLAVMLAATLVLVLAALRGRIGRWVGAGFLAAYCGYMGWLGAGIV
ncbi:calcium/sodium antiporter [Sulfitobacter sp. LCG007]